MGRIGWGPLLWAQLLRFGAVGFLGFLVNAGIVSIVAPFLGPGWAQVVAFPVAASLTWWLNRRYTFGASRHAWQAEWVRYFAANLVGWIANNGAYVLMILASPDAHRHPVLAVAVGSLAGMVFNFTFSKRFVFSQS